MDLVESEIRIELEKRLRTLEVEVRHKTGGSGSDPPPSKHKIRVKHSDSFRKIKRHIVESLDVQGRLSYGDENLDTTSKRVADYDLERGKNFHLTSTERRTRGQPHNIQLQLPEQLGAKGITVEMKIFRTTTVNNLKHKIQDQWGLLVEEQSIFVRGARNECQAELNIMQLKQPIVLEVRWQRKESVRAIAVSNPARGGSTVFVASGKYASPYESSKKKGCAPPKKPNKPKEPEEVQSSTSVPLQHAPYETVYQLGRHFEEFKSDKGKKLLIECTHIDEDKVKISSKLLEKTAIPEAIKKRCEEPTPLTHPLFNIE